MIKLDNPHQSVLAEVAELMEAGFQHRKWNEVALAEQFFHQAASLACEKLGDKHQAYAHALQELASVQEARGEIIDARDNYVKALEILEPQLGNQDPECLAIFHRLHHLYRW